MARCTARYVFLLALDLLMREPTPRKPDGAASASKPRPKPVGIVLDQVKRVVEDFDLGRDALKNLLRTSEALPRDDNLKHIYALLNRLLQRRGIQGVPQILVEHAVDFDRHLAGQRAEKKPQIEKVADMRQRAFLYHSWARGIGSSGSRAMREGVGSAACVLVLELMSLMACYEVEDLLGEDGVAKAAPRSPMDQALKRTSDALRNAELTLYELSDSMYEARAKASSELDCTERLVFRTIEFYVKLNIVETTIRRVHLPDRLGAKVVKDAWESNGLVESWKRIHPMAHTTRALRHLVLFAQFAKDGESLLECWDLMKDLDSTFEAPQTDDDARPHESTPASGREPWRVRTLRQPKNWHSDDPSRCLKPIGLDDKLCAAASAIRQYELELGEDEAIRRNDDERRARRQRVAASLLWSCTWEGTAPCKLHHPAFVQPTP